MLFLHSVEYYHEVDGTAKMSEEELLKFALTRFVSVYMNKVRSVQYELST